MNPNLFSEDTLIEQPAIHLFKDVLVRPSTNTDPCQAHRLLLSAGGGW